LDVEGDDVAFDVPDGVVDFEGLSAGESLHFLRVILCWGGHHFQLAKGCRAFARSYLVGQPWQLMVDLNI
jgi:hypothetical protein